MARPVRPIDSRTGTDRPGTFFVTSRTAGGRSLFQNPSLATLFIDVLRNHASKGTLTVHDFVVMPNHIHILMTVPGDLAIEKAVQLVKGGFSFRARKELGFNGEVWQKGFSEVGVRERENFLEHRRYIEQNPLKAGLVNAAADYPYGSLYLKLQKRATAPCPSAIGEQRRGINAAGQSSRAGPA